MLMRLFLEVAVLTAAIAVDSASGRAAATPRAASMVLDSADFAHGGMVVSQSTKLNSSFPHFPTSSSYNRTFRNVAIGRKTLVTLSSQAAAAKRALGPASFMSEVISITHRGAGRDGFIQGIKGIKGTAPELEFAWLRCAGAPNTCAAIPGATSAAYTVDNADVGATLAVSVTATTANGKATVRSDLTQPVV
jgi:hypothetical protein